MGKRTLPPLADPKRRKYALRHVKRNQLEEERKALRSLTPEQVQVQLQRAAEALRAAGLEGEG
jgi:hypothetical protein